MDPGEERPKLPVPFSSSRYTKLLVSIATNQLSHSGFIAGENDSLGGREPENNADNFGRWSLGRAALNWILTAKIFGLVIQFSSS